MTILRFSGEVVSPPDACSMICSHDSASKLSFVLDLLEVDYAEILSGTLGLTLQGSFVQLGLAPIDTLRFLALSIAEGQTSDVEVLVGAPPALAGVSGVFPLVAGGTFTFQLATYTAGAVVDRFTISTVLQIGDTAVVAAQRINAAAALEGAPTVATVVAGQLQLFGDVPGALQALIVIDEFAALGFPDEATVLGTGSSILVDRVFVASFGASSLVAGEDVWVRGGAAVLHYVAAGS